MLDKLVEIRQLLKGEPTAITRFEDIQKLDEALEALYAEAERRGLKPGDHAIDVTPDKLKPNGSGKKDGVNELPIKILVNTALREP